jgi:hypothetical protein
MNCPDGSHPSIHLLAAESDLNDPKRPRFPRIMNIGVNVRFRPIADILRLVSRRPQRSLHLRSRERLLLECREHP